MGAFSFISSTGSRIFLVFALLACVSQLGSAQQQASANWNWAAYGGEAADGHFVPLDQINPSNVKQLQIAWTYPTHDDLPYLFNPIEADGVLYVLARNNSLVALNAGNGQEIWVHAALGGITRRGIGYWQSKDGKDRRLLFTLHEQLQEIDAQTGKSILTFGDRGYVDLRVGLGRPRENVYTIASGTPGEVYGDLYIIGAATGEEYLAAPGDVRAYDVITGKKVWQFHVIPRPGDPGYNTWPNKDAWKFASGAGPWGDLSIDQQRGIVYFGTGGTKFEFYGADRLGQALFGTSWVAVDARTGKYLWSYQPVHHDVWDYDLPAAPQLTTIEHDGKKVDVVALAGKTCFLDVLDRVTGKPIWPVVERPVPTKSDLPGEQLWPTQPYPTAPPPFCLQQFNAADINPYLPEADKTAFAVRIADDVNGPIFTPPSTRETVQTPGNRGGANWGQEASNPSNGMVYVIGINAPALIKMVPVEKAEHGIMGDTANGFATVVKTPGHVLYEQNCVTCHGVNGQGFGSFPSLVGITQKRSMDQIQNTIQNGAGEMPSYPNLNNAEISEILSYWANPATGGRASGRQQETAAAPGPLGGHVVASGGAPAGQAAFERDRSITNPYPQPNGPPYPKWYTNAPKERYTTGYNVNYGLTVPPFMSLTAYDLNKGIIKWQVPVGGNNPGLVNEQKGEIVTASGLVFLATLDGKVRAYDANNGKLLWTGDLPAGQGAYGIPAMYEWNGREYLVICATAVVSEENVVYAQSNAGVPNTEKVNHGYVAFALPETPASAAAKGR